MFHDYLTTTQRVLEADTLIFMYEITLTFEMFAVCKLEFFYENFNTVQEEKIIPINHL